jgi:hypothetical protein
MFRRVCLGLCVTFHNVMALYGVSPLPSQAGEQPLVCCPWLLMHYICSYLPYTEGISSIHKFIKQVSDNLQKGIILQHTIHFLFSVKMGDFSEFLWLHKCSISDHFLWKTTFVMFGKIKNICFTKVRFGQWQVCSCRLVYHQMSLCQWSGDCCVVHWLVKTTTSYLAYYLNACYMLILIFI